jgi:hypothetical protein
VAADPLVYWFQNFIEARFRMVALALFISMVIIRTGLFPEWCS